VKVSPLEPRPLVGLLYQHDDSWICSTRWIESWHDKPKYLAKTCPSAILSARNPVWPDLGSNSGRRGGKLEFERLSYGIGHNKPIYEL
jgi:hypothetical protein